MFRSAFVVACAVILAGAVPAQAQTKAPAKAPAAIVEDVTGVVGGLQPMDYVYEGQRISLSAGQALTLGYLRSCRVEVIRGGTAVIGAEASSVTGGRIEGRTVECEGSRLLLTAEEAGKSGVVVFRRAPQQGRATLPPPAVVVYSEMPVLDTGAAQTLTVERLDQGAQPLKLRSTGKVDLAREKIRLVPGGLYRASTPAATIVFMVDALATPEPGPLIGRLVRVQ